MNKFLPASILAAGLAIGGSIVATRHPVKPQAAPVAQPAPGPDTCGLTMTHESNYSPKHPIDDGPTGEKWVCNGEVAKNQDELTARSNGARTVNRFGSAEVERY